MSNNTVTLTETGLIALTGIIIAFCINCCKQIEQSRCSRISFCWGLSECDRTPLSSEAIVEMGSLGNENAETKTNL